MQEIGVLLLRLRGGGMAAAPGDLLAVARKNRAPVIAVGLGDLLLRRAVEIHLPKVQVARSHRRIDYLVRLRVDGGFGVVTGGVGQALEVAAVGSCSENVVAAIDCPHVALAVIGFRGAGVTREMSGSVKDVLVIGKEIAAGGPALRSEERRVG